MAFFEELFNYVWFGLFLSVFDDFAFIFWLPTLPSIFFAIAVCDSKPLKAQLSHLRNASGVTLWTPSSSALWPSDRSEVTHVWEKYARREVPDDGGGPLRKKKDCGPWVNIGAL